MADTCATNSTGPATAGDSEVFSCDSVICDKEKYFPLSRSLLTLEENQMNWGNIAPLVLSNSYLPSMQHEDQASR